MIFRKPYALLIKHFKKLHILLLIMTMFIYYKTTSLSGFVEEYLQFLSYDETIESISSYINFNFFLVVGLIIIISSILIYLLTFKKKPKLFYYVVLASYVGLLIIFILINGYYNNIGDYSGTQVALAYRDFLFIFTLPQYVIMLMLIVRSIGLDLKKFGFQNDEEYLAIEREDNEEFEIAVEIDKDKIKRNIKKKLREFRYIYQEYKLIFNIIFVGLFLTIFTVTTVYIYNLNFSYKQGDIISANGYELKINESYLTDKDIEGELILDESSSKQFLVLNVTVKNNYSIRNMNVDMIRVINTTEAYEPTTKYNHFFKDLGSTYNNTDFASGEDKTFILVYEVDKKLEEENFVIYYQDTTKEKVDIKKIKLIVNTFEKTIVEETKIIDETLTIELVDNHKEEIVIDNYLLNKTADYYIRSCSNGNCGTAKNTLTAKDGYVYLHYTFLSDTITTEELITYNETSTKIEYVDALGETITYKLTDVYSKTYNGNNIYTQVPESIMSASKITLIYNLRNKEYKYILLGE